MAPCGSFEGESEAVGVAMPDRKAVDRKVAGVEDLSGRQWDEFKRNGRPLFPPQAREHSDDDLEGAQAAMNRHQVIASPKPQSGKEAGNAEHVVKVAVGQHDPVDPSEARAAAQQLTLGTFSAIH
jgi:hypothetical protein